MGLAEYLHSCLLERGTRHQPSTVRTVCQCAGAQHNDSSGVPQAHRHGRQENQLPWKSTIAPTLLGVAVFE